MHAPPNMLDTAGLKGLGDCGCRGSGGCSGLGDISQYFPDLNPTHLRYLAWAVGGILIWSVLKR